MKLRIENKLNVLMGTPLSNIGRAGNLFWLSFGEDVIVLDRNGCETIKGKYALNIQCSWRITDEDKIIVASRDIYLPKTGLSDEGFEWDAPGSNRFDERIYLIKKKIKSNILVSQILADNLGGLKIYFGSGIVIELFPDDSLEEEFWRFIIFGKKSKHFVVFE